MKENTYYLGIDVGSVSTNFVLINENEEIVEKIYLKTNGQPIKAICEGLEYIRSRLNERINNYGNYGQFDNYSQFNEQSAQQFNYQSGIKSLVKGVGTTGSGRHLAAIIVGADVVKNEITAHAVAAQKVVPDVKTILEIGGQDSKIIILKNGIVYDFAMNTVCAAGTGSFLDRQAARLGIPISEFGKFALRSKSPVRIAGRCAVFAESDMIHKQQAGHSLEDIICGLCEGLVRNYLNNLAKGKEINPPIVFQGGVAANVGIVAAFEKALGQKIIIPEHYDVMGAYGAAIIAREKMENQQSETKFRGFEAADNVYSTKTIECNGCSNICEIIQIMSGKNVMSCWGDRCGKWSSSLLRYERIEAGS